MRTVRNPVKFVAIALVVLLISAAFVAIGIWEDRRGDTSHTDIASDVVVYDGREYARKSNVDTFLVIGLDKESDDGSSDSSESAGARADFLMLFVFDNDAKQCTAVQIDRDTMTKVNKLSIGGTAVVGSYTKQIALAYNYVEDDNAKIRCRNTKDSVEYLLHEINVNHYLSLTMDVVPTLNDMVGGVEVEVLDDFTGIDDELVKGATVKLTGEQALRYVRTRYGLEDSSNSNRMSRQRQYVNALYSTVLSRAEQDADFLVDLVEELDEELVYDSSNEKMQKYSEKFNEYDFLGIREIDGESKVVDGYNEFYPDDDAVWKLLIELFYTPKA